MTTTPATQRIQESTEKHHQQLEESAQQTFDSGCDPTIWSSWSSTELNMTSIVISHNNNINSNTNIFNTNNSQSIIYKEESCTC